jgi:hypothetical protein
MENVENFKIMSKTDNHEYDIQVTTVDEGRVYELRYSNSGIWLEPGKLVLSALDNGNDIEFDRKMKKVVDYGVFAERLILMNFIKYYDKHLMSDLTIVREELIGNI